MRTKSVKTYGGLPVEAVDNNDPFGILAALEDSFIHKMKAPIITKLSKPVGIDELIRKDPVMGFMAEALTEMQTRRLQRRMEHTATKMIRSHFGKYLEKDEEKMLEEQLDGLESIEDKMQAVVNLIDKIKSRRKWKAEQTDAQDPRHYSDKIHGQKELINGKWQWNGTTVHDLPPMTGKGKAHERAYYAMKLPDGRIVNLAEADGEHAAVSCKYPSTALRHMATRLGIEMRGGDCAILNHLLGADMVEWENENGVARKDYKYLPSYTTVWQGVWVVYVGWRKNPKCHASSYWMDGDQLTQRAIEGESPLMVSQLDYSLLTGASEDRLEDDEATEEEQPTDFLNDEEEYVLAGLQRDESDDPLPIDNPLLTAYAYSNDRFIELRNGSAVWNDEEFDETLAEIHLRIENMRLGLKAAKECELFTDKEYIQRKQQEINDLQALVEDMESQMNQCYYPEPKKFEWNMRGTEKHLPAMEPVKEMACFHRMDSYTPPQQVVNEVDVKPPTRITTMQRLKQGTVAAILTKEGWTKRIVPKAKQKPISARNASPRLTAILRKMIREEAMA